MGSPLFSLVHLVINASLIFFVLVVFIETVLFITRIESPRIRIFLRLLPLLKTLFDCALYALHYNIFFNLNPFGCKHNLNTFIKKILLENEFLIDIFSGFFILALALSTLLILRKGYQIICLHIKTMNIVSSAQVCDKPIYHAQLAARLKQHRVKIVITPQIDIPFASQFSCIVLPEKTIDTLSQEEFEAVVAHELEHIRWKDPLTKICLNLFSAFFWWIPTGWWLKKLESDQEEASDQEVSQYSICKIALASAILKYVHQNRKKTGVNIGISQISTPGKKQTERVERLLREHRQHTFLARASTCIATAASTAGAFCLWIC